MDYLNAFFMAWGFFLRIPCPVKKWDEKLKNAMLVMLPPVGLVVGLLWALLGGVLLVLGIPIVIVGLTLTLYIYGVTGFLHLDGLMDCSDAILSGRNLEERRRILKDSTVGAFAVISVVLTILTMFAGTLTLSGNLDWVRFLPLVLIPVLSRTVSGAAILRHKPMETSGYSEMADSRDRGAPSIGLMYLMALVICLALSLIFILLRGDEYTLESLVTLVATSGGTILGTMVAINKARRNLEGMSGDIAGFGICIGEVVGILALAIACAY